LEEPSQAASTIGKEVNPMIRVSVMYPNAPGKKFDWDYYLSKHIPAVRALTTMGLVRVEVDKGIASAQPGVAAPFLAIAHMYFNTVEDVQRFMSGGAELMADLPNFTDIQPQAQISQIV
jgi:uncharacterized protein (TIGR02118 family)